LRKSRFDVAPKQTQPQSREPQDLYRVLPQTQQKKKGPLGGLAYDISRPTLDEETSTSGKGVDVALDPSQLENLTKAELRALHDREEERQRVEKRPYNQAEDVSDMVADHFTAQAAKKRKPNEEKSKSKYKF